MKFLTRLTRLYAILLAGLFLFSSIADRVQAPVHGPQGNRQVRAVPGDQAAMEVAMVRDGTLELEETDDRQCRADLTGPDIFASTGLFSSLAGVPVQHTKGCCPYTAREPQRALFLSHRALLI